MKKPSIILTIMIFIASGLMNTSMAQKDPAAKHSNLLSGGISFMSSGGDLYEYGDDRLIQFQLNSTWANFVTNGLGIGVSLLSTSIAQGSFSTSSLALGPTMMYFISSDYHPEIIRGKVYPYLTSSLLARFLFNNSSADHDTYSGLLYYLGGGVATLLTKSLALNFEIGYQMISVDEVKGNSIDIQIGIIAFL